MHVVFLTVEYPPGPSGGIGTSVRNLARALVAGGHRATVLGCGVPTEFDDQGARVRFLGATRVPGMGWLLNRRLLDLEIRRLVRSEGADLVEAHDWVGPSAGIRPHCPVLIRCHGSATYFADMLGERARPKVRFAEGLALAQADDVVAVSRFAADQTRRVFGLRREIGVIPNGIDVSRFTASGPTEADPESLLYFGSLVRKKGVLDLARIFPAVLSVAPGARLVLVGRDVADSRSGSPSTWALLKEALPADARGRVSYLGSCPHDEIYRHVRRAGVCLFPSYAEALPVSWIEAMACAKPVVAYDVGWASEMIESGVSGVLVPPGDTRAAGVAVGGLLLDRARAEAMGRAARGVAESRFTSEIVAAQSVERYRALLGGAA